MVVNTKHFEIAIYEIFQMVLIDKELLDKRGIPPKNVSKLTFEEGEAVNLYKWIGEKTKGSKQADFDGAKDEFNKYARGMHDEVYLNMYLMALFLLDHYVQTLPKAQQILVGGKVNRLIGYLKVKLMEVEERAAEVITDSSMAASNIFRKYNGQAELTRETREARLKMWRNAAKNRKREE